jgi:hypothetical protein
MKEVVLRQTVDKRQVTTTCSRQVPSVERESQVSKMSTRLLRSQKVFKETEEVAADTVVSEISMMGGGEKQETLQQAKETDLFEKMSEMMEEGKKNKTEILNSLDVLNERFSEKLEREKLQRSKDISILSEERQQTVQGVNGKLNKLSSSMYTGLEFQSEMSKKIGDYKNEVEGEICNIQFEFVKFRQELIIDSFSVFEEKLEAKIDELFNAKLRKLESRLEKLSRNVSVVCGDYCQPSVDSGSNQVHNVDNGHSDLLPTSVLPVVTSCQRNCKSDNNEIECAVTECDGMEVNIMKLSVQ